MVTLALACTAPIACGDDDDDGSDDDRDAGTAGSGGRAGNGGSGGRAGTGGSGGSAGDEAGSGGMGGSAGNEAGSGGVGGSVDEDGGMPDASADAGTTPTLRDVTVDLTNFDPHLNQMMQFRIVSGDDVLVALGVLDPLEDADADFALPNSTPEGDHRLDFFADLNDNRAYNPPPADHAWRLPIAATGDVTVEYTHGTDFTNIAMPMLTQGEDFTFHATDMTPHVGQMFELRVIDEDTGRLCGRYVLGSIESATLDLTLAGIVEDGKSYQVDFSADLNGDGNYDAPPTDHAWRTSGTADATGLRIDFAHNTTFTDVEF